MTKIKETSNYSLFDLHKINRKFKKNKELENSMLKVGFHLAFPIYVVKNGPGKLKIKSGHNRFQTAKKLNLPIKYIVAEDNISIHNIEKSTRPWTLEDFLASHISSGKHAYVVVKKYRERTGIGLRNSIALLAGISAGSNNYIDDFKAGTYELGDPKHSVIVAEIVLHCQECGISFVTHTTFVNAISKVALVKEFKPELFKKKIALKFTIVAIVQKYRLHSLQMTKRKKIDIESYLEQKKIMPEIKMPKFAQKKFVDAPITEELVTAAGSPVHGNLADTFIALNKFGDLVRHLHQNPDLTDADRRRIRSSIIVMKMTIEEIFKSIEPKPQTPGGKSCTP